MFDQKEIQAKLTIDPSVENQTILLDSFRMEQAIINLLENAIRHTDVKGKISLESFKEDEMLIFKIQIEVKGWMRTRLIWERFYKTDPSRSRDESGTGLGFAIVQEIVLTNKGLVKVESEKEIGTPLYIYVPFKK